jgi:hypothetical protein
MNLMQCTPVCNLSISASHSSISEKLPSPDSAILFTAACKHARRQPVLCGGTTYGANNIELIEPGSVKKSPARLQRVPAGVVYIKPTSN